MPCCLLEARVRQPHKTLLLWVVLIVAFLAIWQFLNDQDGPQRSEYAYSDFMALVKAPRDQRHIDEVEIRDRGRDDLFCAVEHGVVHERRRNAPHERLGLSASLGAEASRSGRRSSVRRRDCSLRHSATFP